ncbi:MAG: hypothetical protein IPH13_15545 [Planctomycetes bacterium]|nr:hypothetical protein [Planctomycetota bacterium]MCC7168985.1 hypothetical protein [Planctomycetota bacterium]
MGHLRIDQDRVGAIPFGKVEADQVLAQQYESTWRGLQSIILALDETVRLPVCDRTCWSFEFEIAVRGHANARRALDRDSDDALVDAWVDVKVISKAGSRPHEDGVDARVQIPSSNALVGRNPGSPSAGIRPFEKTRVRLRLPDPTGARDIRTALELAPHPSLRAGRSTFAVRAGLNDLLRPEPKRIVGDERLNGSIAEHEARLIGPLTFVANEAKT